MAYDKVVDSAELDALFTEIAEAIRTKGHTTDPIAHDQMSEAILAMLSGIGAYVWEKHQIYSETLGDVVSRGYVSGDYIGQYASISSGSTTFYNNIFYDSASDKFVGGDVALKYTLSETVGSGAVLLTASEVPNDTYVVYNGRAYKTTSTTKLEVYAKYEIRDDYKVSMRQVYLTDVCEVSEIKEAGFVGYVVSDDENAYTEGAAVDGFHYKKVLPASDETGTAVTFIDNGNGHIAISGLTFSDDGDGNITIGG